MIVRRYHKAWAGTGTYDLRLFIIVGVCSKAIERRWSESTYTVIDKTFATPSPEELRTAPRFKRLREAVVAMKVLG